MKTTEQLLLANAAQLQMSLVSTDGMSPEQERATVDFCRWMESSYRSGVWR